MHQAEQEPIDAHWPIREATSKVEEIISHAESAAGNILDTAELEAERYVREVCNDSEREALEHARALSDLSDSLIAHAEALSRHSRLILEQMSSISAARDVAPDEVIANVPDQGAAAQVEPGPPVPQWPQPDPGPESPISVAPEQTAAHTDSIADSYSAGARMLATQMAVAGSDRSEIRDRLVNDFSIHNPDPLLDAILGRV